MMEITLTTTPSAEKGAISGDNGKGGEGRTGGTVRLYGGVDCAA